eukprot:jgi/Mesvir1/12800/Mv22850-RA.1
MEAPHMLTESEAQHLSVKELIARYMSDTAQLAKLAGAQGQVALNGPANQWVVKKSHPISRADSGTSTADLRLLANATRDRGMGTNEVGTDAPGFLGDASLMANGGKGGRPHGNGLGHDGYADGDSGGDAGGVGGARDRGGPSVSSSADAQVVELQARLRTSEASVVMLATQVEAAEAELKGVAGWLAEGEARLRRVESDLTQKNADMEALMDRLRASKARGDRLAAALAAARAAGGAGVGVDDARGVGAAGAGNGAPPPGARALGKGTVDRNGKPTGKLAYGADAGSASLANGEGDAGSGAETVEELRQLLRASEEQRLAAVERAAQGQREATAAADAAHRMAQELKDKCAALEAAASSHARALESLEADREALKSSLSKAEGELRAQKEAQGALSARLAHAESLERRAEERERALWQERGALSKKFLIGGTKFIKHTSKGGAHRRYVWLTADHTCIKWGKTRGDDGQVGSKRIAVRDITQVVAGKVTAAAGKARSVPEETFLSIIGPRTLDLEVRGSGLSRDEWVELFSWLVKDHNVSHTNPAFDLNSTAPPPGVPFRSSATFKAHDGVATVSAVNNPLWNNETSFSKRGFKVALMNTAAAENNGDSNEGSKPASRGEGAAA